MWFFIDFETLFLQTGWWFGNCGLVNLNGANYYESSGSKQQNVYGTHVQTADWHKGINWYPFFPSTTNRGAQLEVDGGSWATFAATEMKIFTTLTNSMYYIYICVTNQ